jgi:small-conductance mechanosensitive channel
MNQQTQTTETTNAVETAQAKIQNIQTSIVNGDRTLTSKDLASAKAELEFIQLQEEAREIIKQSNAESERKTTLLNLQKRLKVIADSHKVIASKLESFTKSLHEYLTSCSTFQSNLNDIRAALREAALYPESDVIIAGVPPGKVAYGISVQDRLRTLSIGEISVTNVAPEDAVKPILEQALGEYSRHF